MAPTLAILTKARGTFFKPLYEALAQAQPAPWRTLLVWPSQNANEHPVAAVTPQADNLDLRIVSSQSRQMSTSDAALEGRRSTYQTFLPSREAWRTLRAHDVRAVLIHEFSPFTLQGLLLAKWNRLPVVVSTEVGESNKQLFHARTRLWHGFWSRFVDGVAACCPAAHEPLSGQRVPTIATYHAVDSRLYAPLSTTRAENAPVTFAYLGQLIRRKGLDLWLDAALELKAKGFANFRLRFIGGGDEAWLRESIAQRQLDAHCELTGFLSGAAIRDALGTADVFVLPTRQDTYAAVVHEAACLGLPLLVSKHAGAAEALVRDGENGFVFDPADTASFAQRMSLLMDDTLRLAMGPCSRALGEMHSAHVRGAALWQFFENLPANPTRSLEYVRHS
ncbi:MAG: glycosyltransferase family 4 protein [Roseimicrobium sp.]